MIRSLLMGTVFMATFCTVFGFPANSSELESDEVGLLQSKFEYKLQKSAFSPYNIMHCTDTPILQTSSLTYDMYDSVVKEMRLMYNALSPTCDVNSCPRGDLAGCVVRTAAHDFMDGKADGCIALDDADNNGLSECLYSLADVYATFCAYVSLADFLVISAEAVMTFTREHALEQDQSRAHIDFRSNFKYGRRTSKECAWAYGRMPQAEQSCNEVEEVLERRLGLTNELSAALLGAHTLGRADLNVSGYDGSWVEIGSINKFDNGYYQSLLVKGWGPRKSVGGNPDRNQWDRIDIGGDWRHFGKELMLNTDICLFHTTEDLTTRIDINARTDDCCAWTVDHMIYSTIAKSGGKFCGMPDYFTTHTKEELFAMGKTSPPIHAAFGSVYDWPVDKLNFSKQRVLCCSFVSDEVASKPMDLTPNRDCGLPGTPSGRWNKAVYKFAEHEDVWLEKFLEAWQIATGNSLSSLSPLGRSTE